MASVQPSVSRVSVIGESESVVFKCKRCGVTVQGLQAARKHARQGYRTQREAFQAGELHALERVIPDK